jgi:hypothetical protein
VLDEYFETSYKKVILHLSIHIRHPWLIQKQYNHLKEGIKYYLIIYVQMGIIICAFQILVFPFKFSEGRAPPTAAFWTLLADNMERDK